MERGEDQAPISEKKLGTVSKLPLRLLSHDFFSREVFLESAEGDAAQSDIHSGVRQKVEFLMEELPAVFEFLRLGFIVGRRTADRAGDPGILECEPIACVIARGLVRKTCFMESPKEPIPASVSSENPTRTVRSMSGWGKPNKDDPCSRISKAVHRFPPVSFACEGFTFIPGDL